LTGITQVFGKERGKLVRNAALLTALACMAVAFGGTPRAALDVAIRETGGHALLRFGAATVSVAFDFGQECAKSNACSGAIL